MNARGVRLFTDYASCHASPGNRICHAIGIPLIVFSLILALVQIPIGGFWTAAEVTIAGAAALQFRIDAPSASVFLIFEVFCDLLSREVSIAAGARTGLLLAAALFAAGWIFQFAGHGIFEKNRPAFSRNLVHLLVGPLWIARKLFT